MHVPIAILLFALSGNDLVAAEPSPLDTGSLVSQAPTTQQPPTLPLEVADSDRRGLRADPSTQLMYSTIGGGLGIVGGGFLGGIVGAGLSSESDDWASSLGNVILGIGIGVLAGGTTGATWGATAARPKQKNRSFVPTALGGFGGLVLGFASGIATYNAYDSDNSAVSALCFLALPALGAGAGATLADQWTSPRRITAAHSPTTIALAPWMPRDGLIGMRATFPTGI